MREEILSRSKQNGESVIFCRKIFYLDRNFLSPKRFFLSGYLSSPIGTILAV